RVTALQQIGGFAPHDADDLLATVLYGDRGWRGVYVPRLLAKGLTPVDWQGYLTQQHRWGRSILYITIRVYPQSSQGFSLKSRLMSFLHGLNYIHRSFVILASLLLIASMLSTGTLPHILSYALVSKICILFATSQCCEFFRQCFFIDSKHEW